MNVITKPPRKPKSSDITTGPLPASRKIYLGGKIHKDIRVPMREISTMLCTARQTRVAGNFG